MFSRHDPEPAGTFCRLMKAKGDAHAAGSDRRALLEEPTLYEAQHAAQAFGIELLAPEPLSTPAELHATPAALHASPWEEATVVPPVSGQPTQALPQVAFAATQHAVPLSAALSGPSAATTERTIPNLDPGAALAMASLTAGTSVTEVRPMPRPPASAAPSVGRRQRLYYPFLVGTIGGLCGLLVAMGGLRVFNQRRAREQVTRAQTQALQQQLMEQVLRALLSGRPQEARTLLHTYQQRWPTLAVRQLLNALEQPGPHQKDRR